LGPLLPRPLCVTPAISSTGVASVRVSDTERAARVHRAEPDAEQRPLPAQGCRVRD